MKKIVLILMILLSTSVHAEEFKNRHNYMMGNAYLKVKDYDQAIFWYKKVIEINPKIYVAHNNMGVAYLNKKEYTQGLEACRNAIKINPERHMAYFNMGIIFDHQKAYIKAIELYQKTIAYKFEYNQKQPNLLVWLFFI